MEQGMISIDRWSKGSQAYFLTHLHLGRTEGLSSTWSSGPLYCSCTTARLLLVKFPNFNTSSLRVMYLGTWYLLSLSSPSTGAPVTVQVMAIDAIHCIGAVMFLFKGDFGHLLYTGDFRWEITGQRSKEARRVLLNALDGKVVDVLYLDNTYCNPAYCFPTRVVAAHQVIDIIKSHPKHDIIIAVDSLGKEELLLRIADILKTKIWVWPERLAAMHCLGLFGVFTTRTSETRVRAVPHYSFSIETLEGLNQIKPTIGIMPSGFPWLEKITGSSSVNSTCERKDQRDGALVDLNTVSVEKVHRFIYVVPYSDHSCFPELENIFQLLQPSVVKGIVSSSPWYVDPDYYLGLKKKA